MPTIYQTSQKETAQKSIANKTQLKSKKLNIKRTPKLSDGGYVWAG